jgi:hypothetical protein
MPDTGNWNCTPSCVDDSHYRAIIRDKVRPFTPRLVTSGISPKQIKPFQPPQPVAPKVTPLESIGNRNKVIDFALATITEAEKRQFIHTMMELCERLSACWNTPVYDVNEAALMALFNHYSWRCPVTQKVHSHRFPLTIEFLCPVWQGGKIQLSNMRPRFMGWLPGEYRWHSKPSLAELALSA